MQTKTKTEKIFYRQIHKIQKCILQIDIQNTNIQIAKMHNADKSQNTNTHDLNAKKKHQKAKKARELVGHAVVGEYVWNHQDG